MRVVSNSRFGNVEVVCEGYDYPDDPFILKGSCGLEYTLDYTMEGRATLNSPLKDSVSRINNLFVSAVVRYIFILSEKYCVVCTSLSPLKKLNV